MDEGYTKFSDSLAASFTKLYKVGGLALVFIFIGIMTMIVGNFSASNLSGWIFAVGALITLICLGLFVYTQLQGPVKARRMLQDNKETIDAIQEIALELTRLTGAVQSYTFKYSKQVDKVLDSAVPLVANIPGMKSKMDAWGVSDARNASKMIVDLSTDAEVVIKDVEYALVHADAKKLQTYSKEIKQITQTLRTALATASPKKV